MSDNAIHAVTGAFGYSGKYIARRLLDQGRTVVTLTHSPNRPNPFGDRVRTMPFHFDAPDALTDQLRGVETLYNTYWIRFNHPSSPQADAVHNTLVLFEAARRAGVQRIVHISITNPSENSPLPYFRNKAILEKALIDSGVSYAILRPAVLFGEEDVLVNNIAWMLRHLPVFGIFGDGRYRLRPIHVDDLASLAVEQGRSRDNVTLNAVGPDRFTYRELVRTISRAIGHWRPMTPVPPWFGLAAAWLLGRWMGDIVVTRDEIEGLMSNLLDVDGPPTGVTSLMEWAKQHADQLGRHYANELARRKDRQSPYRAN
ncbi:MAG: NAD-dependent epimerase/dehydratase family protein [Thermoguttaceae bacterium]